MIRALPVLFFLCVLIPLGAFAQPVPPSPGVEFPQAYFDRIAQDKTAFQFQRAWIQKAQRAKETRREFFEKHWQPEMTPASIPQGVRETMMISGTAYVPVFMAKFSTTGADPYPVSELQTKLFAPPPAASMTGLYDEMSYGALNLTGTVYDWVTVSNIDTYYEGGCNGLLCPTAKTGQFIKEILQLKDPSVDFGLYDNDGPDGLPNSGDDDGFVDFVAFVHPEVGGECGTTNIWSHRWVVAGWPEFNDQPWTTNDPRTGGGLIMVWDYTIQPALGSANGCGTGINEIGVFCHEFGHAFGLPDLYDGSGSEGIGHWGLMSSGNWNTPTNPAHMCAWSKMELGWILPTVVGPTSQAYTINNSEVNAEAFKLDVMEEKFSRKLVAGSYRLHCGLTASEADARRWPGSAGYGNAWDESMRREFSYNGTNPVTLEFDYMYHTEANFDFGYMKIDVNGTVSTLAEFDDFGVGHAVIDLTPYVDGSGASSYRLIAEFQSDAGFSDEDGNFNSGAAGPFAVDNVSVIGGGENYFADFEQHENGWYYDFNVNAPKEFFLVENRNTAGAQFDQGLHGQGLVIYHVEQNMMAPWGMGNTGGETNVVIRGMMLEEADGLDQLAVGMNRGDGGDVFPGTASNTTFTNETIPGSKSHNEFPTNVLVEDISAPGSQMTATMRGGHLPVVASSISPNFGYSDFAGGQMLVTALLGQEFLHGVTFLLRDDAQNEFPAAAVEWVGRTTLAGVLDLSALTDGTYDVVVRNPDGQEAVLADAYEVRRIVPVFVQAFDARTTAKGIELTWDVWSDEAVEGYKTTRVEEGSTLETVLQDGELIAPDLRVFVDETVHPATDYEYFLTVVLEGGAEYKSRGTTARSESFALSLMQNSPNPFNPSTRITFSLPERTQVALAVYDAQGRPVVTLVDTARPAGMNEVVWDGKNASGNRVSSGIYFYRLKTADKVLTRKMLLLK
jgi:M6 family metalloprotease-like protein